MEQKKFKLSEEVQTQLRLMRQHLNLAAEDVSTDLGKSKAWLGQIERGKLLSIKREDLVNLLLMYTTYSEHEILNKGVLENFVSTGIATLNTHEAYDWYEDVEAIKSYFFDYLRDTSSKDELESKLIYIRCMLRCLEAYPGATALFFQNFFLFENILDNYKDLSQDQYLNKVASLHRKLENILQEEYDKSTCN